jgi:hypothetical protein
MALVVALAFRPTTEDLALGSADDRPFADQAMAPVEGGEAPRTTEGIAGVGDRRLELGGALRIAAAMADKGVVLWRIEAATIEHGRKAFLSLPA